MAVDLHAHSTASDGSESPTRIVELAIEAGLSTLALTDHDTQEGIAEARKAAAGSGLDLIPGTELSLEYDAGGMHLVVLWLEPGSGPLQDRLSSLQAGRSDRNQAIVDRLVDLGMSITLEEVHGEAGGGSVGRPHIAAVMIQKGYVETGQEAFERFLGSGMPAYVGRPRLEPDAAISLAVGSGAVPILAHPHTLNINRAPEMADLLTRLKGAGLVGLEAMYSSYRQHERDGYADLARRFGIVPSGGSDFHGSYKPGLELGTGYGDLFVDDNVAAQLKEHIQN
jgi:hypothetical protein